MKAESERLRGIIAEQARIYNSIGAKLERGFGALATPEGAVAALLVLGAVGYLGYSMMKSRR